jgi:hypothetical protein
MDRTARLLMDAEIERLRPLCLRDNGATDDGLVVEGLTTFVQTRATELFDAETFARQRYDDYQRARAPFRARGAGALQLGLPALDAIIQLGDNTSITLRDARREHLTRRREMLRDQSEAQQLAYAREVT